MKKLTIEITEDETGKLAQKVVDLNAIYGNMLNAING